MGLHPCLELGKRKGFFMSSLPAFDDTFHNQSTEYTIMATFFIRQTHAFAHNRIVIVFVCNLLPLPCCQGCTPSVDSGVMVFLVISYSIIPCVQNFTPCPLAKGWFEKFPLEVCSFQIHRINIFRLYSLAVPRDSQE